MSIASTNSLGDRINRMTEMADQWNLVRPHAMMVVHRIDPIHFSNLQQAVLQYVSRALRIHGTPLTDSEIGLLSPATVDLHNVTPNGAVVPKKEYQLEFNLVLREWTKICKAMISPNPKLLTKFRVTPNIRLKFSKEQNDNIGRPLNTSLLHSDAWVEGPWGMNCFIPLAGDTASNTLEFWDTDQFSDDYLRLSPSYEEMSWVQPFFSPIPELIPEKGNLHISDYSLLHRTIMKPACGARLSIDTTIMVGNHELMIRSDEYIDEVPAIGDSELVIVERSENDEIKTNTSAFHHYTSGSLRLVKIC